MCCCAAKVADAVQLEHGGHNVVADGVVAEPHEAELVFARRAETIRLGPRLSWIDGQRTVSRERQLGEPALVFFECD